MMTAARGGPLRDFQDIFILALPRAPYQVRSEDAWSRRSGVEQLVQPSLFRCDAWPQAAVADIKTPWHAWPAFRGSTSGASHHSSALGIYRKGRPPVFRDILSGAAGHQQTHGAAQWRNLYALRRTECPADGHRLAADTDAAGAISCCRRLQGATAAVPARFHRFGGRWARTGAALAFGEEARLNCALNRRANHLAHTHNPERRIGADRLVGNHGTFRSR